MKNSYFGNTVGKWYNQRIIEILFQPIFLLLRKDIILFVYQIVCK